MYRRSICGILYLGFDSAYLYARFNLHLICKDLTVTSSLYTMAKKDKKPSPFGLYFNYLKEVDGENTPTEEFGSMLILSLVEEIGEMARAYLAKHGRKGTNLAAQNDETYEQELGDIMLSIVRFARIKNINLHKRLMYSLRKIKGRKTAPKGIPVYTVPLNN